MDGQGTNERNWNSDWNPIWDVRTGRFDGGWSFEARIPFKSLQYRPGRLQVWGFQMRRRSGGRTKRRISTRPRPGAGADGRLPGVAGGEPGRARGAAVGQTVEIKPYAIGISPRIGPPCRTSRMGRAAMSAST